MCTDLCNWLKYYNSNFSVVLLPVLLDLIGFLKKRIKLFRVYYIVLYGNHKVKKWLNRICNFLLFLNIFYLGLNDGYI